MKKVAFYTLGCKVNQYETNAMEQQFINGGYTVVDNTENADVYVVNTCTVTNIAERKSRQMIRRTKQINPYAIVIVCGCYVQVARKDLEQLEDIDLLIDTSEKNNIINILEAYKNSNKKTKKPEKQESDFLDFGSVTYTENNRAVVKVQDGCNMFCTYCIIPYARGRIRSRKIDSVVEEVKQIAKEGIKEIVITGIHIASYGKDFDDECSSNIGSKIRLIDLLEAINPIEGIERIRLGSLEPTIITPEFLDRLTKLEKICDHFHLSLQSGCDATLKRMNRKYTTQEFKNIVDLLKKAYPNISLTTDIIVGFPGENDEEFDNTYNFLKSIDFYKMHIFKYSIRNGTVAEKMPNQVSGLVKEERSKKLIYLSNLGENAHNNQYLGKIVKVLFEEYENGCFKGHTTNYMVVKVKCDSKNDFVNKIVDIKITENDEKTRELMGTLYE